MDTVKRIPKTWCIFREHAIGLAVVIFIAGFVVGQYWRITQVEPAYKKEVADLKIEQQNIRSKINSFEVKVSALLKAVEMRQKAEVTEADIYKAKGKGK